MNPKFIVKDLVAHLVNEIKRDPAVAPQFSRMNNAIDVWKSMLFCILSSQVRASSALKAVDVLIEDIPFFDSGVTRSEVLQVATEALARKARHRFPNSRARQVADSWFAFAQLKGDHYEYLDSFESEFVAREEISKLFPGLGLKQASMFLRDIGYAQSLCIIDTHIVWYCANVHGIKLPALTAKKYIELERDLLQESAEFGVTADVFDSAVWVAVKTFKDRQCTMQFA